MTAPKTGASTVTCELLVEGADGKSTPLIRKEVKFDVSGPDTFAQRYADPIAVAGWSNPDPDTVADTFADAGSDANTRNDPADRFRGN